MDNSVALEGFGGGGNPLNFKLVGNPQPTNPKENTIWVNTNVKITSWHFGVEEPDLWAFVENAGTVLGSLHGRTYVKKNSGRAVYAFCQMLYSGPIIVSTDPNAVITSFEGFENNTFTNTVTVDGIVYYYNSFGGFEGASVDQITPSFKMYDSPDNHAMRLAKLLATNKSTEGTVWITTGTSSPVAFNALKKNSITVYPISAKLFSGGMWWDLEAKSYQNGAWVDWIPDGYLFYSGAGERVPFTLKKESSAIVTITNDYVQFDRSALSNSQASYYVQKSFDGYNWLKARVHETAQGERSDLTASLAYSTGVPEAGRNQYTRTAEVVFSVTSEPKVYQIDISAQSGTFYVAITGGMVGKVYDIWLEK